MKILVTGSSGLIGSEAVTYYDDLGFEVIGVDNNMRQVFFGERGDTRHNLSRLKHATNRFTHFNIDIRDRKSVNELFATHRFERIIHCAAQPSHDLASQIPVVDFEVNALGTVHLLEATRTYCPEAVFIHMSTNKVYGDAPNEVPLVELERRWEYANEADYKGISESCRIDQSLHSMFGASKVSADIVAQEYGRYYGLNVGIFRGGCLTGPSHAGVELHGFLSYLVKVIVHEMPYTIFGYKGKQVRDQIHSLDVVRAFDTFAANPRPGQVYNLGGGRQNNASVLESIDMVEQVSGKKLEWTYDDTNRMGDHICYISDLTKLKQHYPDWDIRVSLPAIIDEMVSAEMARLG